MNFGDNEGFFERHRYLFQHCYFQFEGLEADIQIRFENIIKRLSGVICKDSDYILTDKSYFNRTNNRTREDLYSVNYVLDSIRAKQALDISSYRFKIEKVYQSIDACCLFSKYILQTDSCKRYYCDKICLSCIIDNDLNEFVSMTIENRDTTVPKSPNILKDNKKQNENAEAMKVSNNAQSVNGTSTKEITKKTRKYVQFENNEQIKKHKSRDDDLLSKESISSSKGTNSKFKEIRISDWKKKVNTTNNDSVGDSLPDPKNNCNYYNIPNKIVSRKRSCRISLDRDSAAKDEDKIKTRKFRKLCPRSSEISFVSLEMDDESSESTNESVFSTSEEEVDENNSNEWWNYLPPLNRLFPTTKPANGNTYIKRRGANFTEREQKLMLSYLITKRKIASGTSRITWKELHEDGYLKNRSTESLRNNFRRVILPKIHTFRLPQFILQQFLKLN